jgi:hypothetical protein
MQIDEVESLVIVQLMTEVCNLAAPFTKVLSSIHDELEVAIYSNYVAPSGTTVFEQVVETILCSCN